MSPLTTIPWRELPNAEQQRIVHGMARMIGAKDLDALRRVFELGQPAIEKGTETNGQPITRVAASSVPVLRTLIENYVPCQPQDHEQTT